ncbi:MAG: branched-chain amino acid ABC transporter permease [Deltaproteobacteria bacterium]|nr:branched-chain amino acid ABC transporter permease [Deltaproteobacteria bacterium]
MNFWAIQILNGVSLAMLLFLIASGLSLIFGLMRIANLAHGSFYLVGAYVGLEVLNRTESFSLAAVVACVGVPLAGIALQRLFLNRLHGQELPQVLLTFGFMFILGDLCLVLWGGTPQTLPKPALFVKSIRVAGIFFPTYRLFVIGAGLLVVLGLWLFLEKTRVGAMVRAGVDDAEMARAVGVNVPFVFTGVFGLGVSLAALAGLLGGPIIGAFPGLDVEILLLALVVVVIGGMGSVKGAFFGSLMVGLLDNFGKALFPELAFFTIFAPMALVLALRPKGLFGR